MKTFKFESKKFKVMFCRVCGFRVRVWESCRTSTSFRYGYGSVTELTEVPGINYGTGVQNPQKFRAGTRHAVPVPRVLWHGSYRTHRSSGTGMKVLQKIQKFRVLWHGRTELPEVPNRYENAVPVPRVFVALAYRTSRSSGYGYEFLQNRSSGFG